MSSIDANVDDSISDADSTPVVPVGQSLLASATAAKCFPCFGCPPTCGAHHKVQDLLRLATLDLNYSQFLNARLAMQLIATMTATYKNSTTHSLWHSADSLKALTTEAQKFGLFLSFMFDIATNAEYLHGRMVSTKWIMCDPPYSLPGLGAKSDPVAFFSFLKQCPRCSHVVGLEKRLTGAQHKPSSHHIGEITASITAILLALIAKSAAEETHVALVTKQSHDADAVIFSKSRAILLEIKSSPLVTYSVLCRSPKIKTTHPMGRGQKHSLVDIEFGEQPIYLYIPNRGIEIPLGVASNVSDASFPYPELSSWFTDPIKLLVAFDAWLEVYNAYQVPKRERNAQQMRLSYLTNGWGDEIDSNKTKAGLGRTDDLKKGTYQLLKYGAYYQAECPNKKFSSALCSNMDPAGLSALYLDKLLDLVWARPSDLVPTPTGYTVAKDALHHVYDAVVAFNKMQVQNPELVDTFSLDRAAQNLLSGKLDFLLNEWQGTNQNAGVEIQDQCSLDLAE